MLFFLPVFLLVSFFLPIFANVPNKTIEKRKQTHYGHEVNQLNYQKATKVVSITIIIPVYNVEPFVKRCIESVIVQGHAEANLECIIVDDCGTDGSMDIVRQTIEDYQGPIHFSVIRHERNRGLSVARNTGVEHAKGDYVMFVDSDDYLLPESLSYFLENLAQHPNVDMIMGNVENKKGGNLLMPHIAEPELMDDCNVFFYRVLHHQIYLYAWNKLIRRSVLADNHIAFLEGTLYEDQLWSYLLFSRISSVLLLPRVTYIYEYNINSIVNTTFTSEKADRVVWSYTVSCNEMLNHPPVPGRYRRNMTVDYLLFMMNFLMNGVDLSSRCEISAYVAQGFLKVRRRIFFLAMRYGRFLLALFFLLLFSPFSKVQKLRLFRHHYYDIESSVNILAHLTDFLHQKNRI